MMLNTDKNIIEEIKVEIYNALLTIQVVESLTSQGKVREVQLLYDINNDISSNQRDFTIISGAFYNNSFVPSSLENTFVLRNNTIALRSILSVIYFTGSIIDDDHIMINVCVEYIKSVIDNFQNYITQREKEKVGVIFYAVAEKFNSPEIRSRLSGELKLYIDFSFDFFVECSSAKLTRKDVIVINHILIKKINIDKIVSNKNLIPLELKPIKQVQKQYTLNNSDPYYFNIVCKNNADSVIPSFKSTNSQPNQTFMIAGQNQYYSYDEIIEKIGNSIIFNVVVEEETYLNNKPIISIVVSSNDQNNKGEYSNIYCEDCGKSIARYAVV